MVSQEAVQHFIQGTTTQSLRFRLSQGLTACQNLARVIPIVRLSSAFSIPVGGIQLTAQMGHISIRVIHGAESFMGVGRACKIRLTPING